MRYRKLSPTGDYTFGSGQLNFWINVPDAVGQAVETGLLLWVGEWYLNTTDGTPWPEGVLGKHTQAEADATIKARTLQVQGMVDIPDYESVIDPDSRGMAVTMSIDTIYGPTQVQVQNDTNF